MGWRTGTMVLRWVRRKRTLMSKGRKTYHPAAQSQDLIDITMKKMDRDKDGKVSFTDYTEMVRGGRRRKDNKEKGEKGRF